MCTHTLRHTHTCAHTRTHTETHMCTHTDTQTCAHTDTHTDTETHTDTHAEIHTHMHTDTHTHRDTHMCTQIHTRAHKDTQTHTHTCTHTQIHARKATSRHFSWIVGFGTTFITISVNQGPSLYSLLSILDPLCFINESSRGGRKPGRMLVDANNPGRRRSQQGTHERACHCASVHFQNSSRPTFPIRQVLMLKF